MIRRYSEILILSIILLALNVLHADDYELKYKMQKGKIYKYSSVDSVDMLQEIMGMQQKVNTVASGIVTIQSEGSDDAGNVAFLMWYEALEMTVASMMMDTTLTNPTGFVNKKIRKTIKPNGDQIQSTEVDPVDAQLRQQLPVDKEFFLNLPEGKLKKDETVTQADSDTLSLMGGIMTSQSQMAYVVNGTSKTAGHECVVVNFNGTVEINGNMAVGGMQLAMEGDGKVSGVICFAPDQGILVSSNQIVAMEMSATMTGAQNMTIPITQTMTSRITLMP